jgi:hypothetical protein
MSEGDAPKLEVANGKVFDLEEVKKHSREDDCWLVVEGDVFDVTDFLDEHPGGFDIIISNTGTLIKQFFTSQPLNNLMAQFVQQATYLLVTIQLWILLISQFAEQSIPRALTSLSTCRERCDRGL